MSTNQIGSGLYKLRIDKIFVLTGFPPPGNCSMAGNLSLLAEYLLNSELKYLAIEKTTSEDSDEKNY